MISNTSNRVVLVDVPHNAADTKGTINLFGKMNKTFAWFVVPTLGVVIPTVAGFIKPSSVSYPLLFLQYAIFIGIALIIYKGNMFFLHSIKLRYKGNNMPHLHIVIIYFLVNIVYSGILCLATLSAWNSISGNGSPFSQPVITTTLVVLVFVLFINNLYEVFYLQAAKEASDKKMVLLENARMQAELQALNSEIDPHFMYNALTSLSYLLQQNPAEADNYNAMLAAQYRYVLKNKCCHLVPLSKELEFCQQYFAIQQLRFGKSVALQINECGVGMKHLKVPPLSVQTLVENALKHNSFSDQDPLNVQVRVCSSYVTVTNKTRPHQYPTKSTGIGLPNLDKRVLLLARQNLRVDRKNGEFSVRLPVVVNHGASGAS